MTKVLKIAGLTLAILLEWLLILVIFLVFAIRSSWVQTYLANRATAYLSSELHAKVDIGAVDIVLFRYVDLKDVYLEAQNKKQPILALKHLYLGLDQFQLLQNKLLIKELRLYGGKVNLARDAQNGRYNFAFIEEYFASDTPNKSSTDFQVELAQLSLAHINLSYHDLRKDTLDFGIDFDHLELKDLHLKANKIYSKGSFLSCQIRDLQFLERSGFQLDKLTAYAQFSSKGLVLRKANLQTSKSRLLIPKLALGTRSSEDFNAFDDRVVFDAVMAPE